MATSKPNQKSGSSSSSSSSSRSNGNETSTSKPTTSSSEPDVRVLNLIKKDHEEFKKLFKQFEKQRQEQRGHPVAKAQKGLRGRLGVALLLEVVVRTRYVM